MFINDTQNKIEIYFYSEGNKELRSKSVKLILYLFHEAIS